MPLDETRRNTPTGNTAGTYAAVNSATGMDVIDLIALVLMIVGGINWGLVGLFNIDLVAALFGPMTIASRGVYTLVGIAAIYGIVMAMKQANRLSASAL